jgi:hypothetical protein
MRDLVREGPSRSHVRPYTFEVFNLCYISQLSTKIVLI